MRFLEGEGAGTTIPGSSFVARFTALCASQTVRFRGKVRCRNELAQPSGCRQGRDCASGNNPTSWPRPAGAGPFGMTSHIPLQHDGRAVLSRGTQLLLRYFVGLVVVPQLVLGLGLLVVQHADWVYSLLTLPLILYCAPVVGVFGNAHFITHATLCPADLTGWVLVVAFYSAAALFMAALHTLVTRRRSRAEPEASPNGGPALGSGNSGAGSGPPPVN